jgi:hypothetical protein
MWHSAEFFFIWNLYVDPALCGIARDHDPAQCSKVQDNDHALCGIAQGQNGTSLDPLVKLEAMLSDLKEQLIKKDSIWEFPYMAPTK